jgi:hypothetical protein
VNALRRAVGLFVDTWKRRQLFCQSHPEYAAPVIAFVSV